MRLLLIVPAVALCLSACGKSDQAEEQNAGRAMTAEAISSNDVTAIDAVTGEAANMAADVDITSELAEAANGVSTTTNTATRGSRSPASGSTARSAANSNSAAPAEGPEEPSGPESNAAD